MIARSSGAGRELEIEVIAVAPAQDDQRAAASVGESALAASDPARRTRVSATARGEPRAAPPSEPGGAPVEIPAAPAGPPPEEYGGAPSADTSRGVAGLNGVPIWQIPGVISGRTPSPAAPTAPPAARATPIDKAGEVLRDAMRTRDKDLGLDLPAAGTVATVLADAVRSSDTPSTSRATFEVVLNGAGQVIGVRVTSTNAGAADLWARVAREAAAKLSGRVHAMGAAFAKGAKIYVTVSSAVKMPSGAESGGIHKGDGAGFAFDVSELGAHAARTVQSSFRVVALD